VVVSWDCVFRAKGGAEDLGEDLRPDADLGDKPSQVRVSEEGDTKGDPYCGNGTGAVKEKCQYNL